MYEIKFHRQKLTQNTEKEVNQKKKKKKKRKRRRRRRRKRRRTVRVRTRTTKSKRNQTKCNLAIINQTQRKKQPKFKAYDMVPVKIDHNLYCHLLLGILTSGMWFCLLNYRIVLKNTLTSSMFNVVLYSMYSDASCFSFSTLVIFLLLKETFRR